MISTVEDLLKVIVLTSKAHIPLLLCAHRGLGKTTVMRDLCKNPGTKYADARVLLWGTSDIVDFVNFRGSQVEPSDLRGFPFLSEINGEKVTKYARQEEMPGGAGRGEKGILFLDELFRAPDDVRHCMMQVLETEYNFQTGEFYHRIGEHIFPSEWYVHAATNPPRDTQNYSQVGGEDQALLSRLCNVIYSPDFSKYAEEFHHYIKSKYNQNSDKLDDFMLFVNSTSQYLLGEIGNSNIDLAPIDPCPRSNEMVARVILANDILKFDDRILMEVLGGIVGSAAASSFSNFSPEIRPIDIIKLGRIAYQDKLSTIDINLLRTVISCISYNFQIIDTLVVEDLETSNQYKSNVCIFLGDCCELLNRRDVRDVVFMVINKLLRHDFEISWEGNGNKSMINALSQIIGEAESLTFWENIGSTIDNTCHKSYRSWISALIDEINKENKKHGGISSLGKIFLQVTNNRYKMKKMEEDLDNISDEEKQ